MTKGFRWLWIGAAVIAVTCAGCGGKAGDHESPAVTKEESPMEGDGGTEENKDETERKEETLGESAQTPDGEDGKGNALETSQADGENGQDRGAFTTGTWNGLTFENSWLNLSIPFPEGSKVFSAEEMRQLVGARDDILVNSGSYEDIREKVPQAVNIYDFMVTMPDGKSSVQLAYMSVANVAPGQEISAADCLEEMAGELASIGDMGYEIQPMEKRAVGGQSFDWFSASLMGGAMYQEYYGILAGDHVAVLTATYDEAGREAVEAMIQSVEPMERKQEE